MTGPNSPWRATVTRTGRWWWNVNISCGGVDPGWNYPVLSKARAERKARKLLARRELERQRSREAFTIRLNDEQ